MQNPIIRNIIAKISHKYPEIDTILLFGSALDPDWTEKSKKLAPTLKTIAPDFLQIIKEYELATSLDKNLQALQKLQNFTEK